MGQGVARTKQRLAESGRLGGVWYVTRVATTGGVRYSDLLAVARARQHGVRRGIGPEWPTPPERSSERELQNPANTSELKPL